MPDTIARDLLRSIVERIERLEEEKSALAEDIKEVYAEAKSAGFDTKTLRAVIKLRKQDTAERQEAEALLDLYLTALGDTPIERFIQGAADAGLMSKEAAAETQALNDKLKTRQVTITHAQAKRIAEVTAAHLKGTAP